jgi:hypothetical protein
MAANLPPRFNPSTQRVLVQGPQPAFQGKPQSAFVHPSQQLIMNPHVMNNKHMLPPQMLIQNQNIQHYPQQQQKPQQAPQQNYNTSHINQVPRSIPSQVHTHRAPNQQILQVQANNNARPLSYGFPISLQSKPLVILNNNNNNNNINNKTIHLQNGFINGMPAGRRSDPAMGTLVHEQPSRYFFFPPNH